MPEKTSFYDRVPLVELHLHLEGAFSPSVLWELCRKYGGDPSVPDFESFKRRFIYRDFPHFIETWIWKDGFLREYEDFTYAAEHVARNLAAQGIAYAEVFYSPGGYADRGLSIRKLTEAVRKGLSRVPAIEVSLIIDLIRDLGPVNAERSLMDAYEVKELGVIGIGIGGMEHKFPPEPFETVYEHARSLGFHTTAHAGEAAGAESVWGALRSLNAERIGHGTRAIEDEALISYLAETKIPVEMCPLSNVCTGVVASIEDHPVRKFFDRGILVTINTDDPAMFGNTLAGEYATLERVFGFTPEEILELKQNAVRASWMSETKKRGYLGNGTSVRRNE